MSGVQGGDPGVLPQHVHPEREHRPLLHPQHPLQPLRYGTSSVIGGWRDRGRGSVGVGVV